MVPALGDGRTYRVSTHVSVLNTMTEVCNDEYYVDTVMKECDNAEDGTKSTVSADFGDMTYSGKNVWQGFGDIDL